MNQHELRLKLGTEIKNLILDMSYDEKASDQDKFETEQAAANFSDFLMDSLAIQVIDANQDGTEMTIKISLVELES